MSTGPGSRHKGNAVADTKLTIESGTEGAGANAGTGGQPITRHPLFPAIVALWFGALAGLGSVIVSSSTIEGLVLALGIDKVIPMAAPPLGTTMRILLALGMTGLGAAIGGLIARRIARPAALPATDAAEGDEIEQAAAAPAPTARRRRALAIEPEAAPVAEEHAPLPGAPTDPRILNVADFDIDSFDEGHDQPVFRRPVEAAAIDSTADDADEDDNLPAWLDAETAWREPESTFGADRGVFTTPPGAQIFKAELDAAEEAAREYVEAPVGSRLFEAYSREFSPRSDVKADAAPETVEDPLAGATSSLERAAPGFKLLPRLPQGDWDTPEAEFEAEEAPAWSVPAFAAPAAKESPSDQAPSGIEIVAFHEEPAPFAAPFEAEPEAPVETFVDAVEEPRSSARIADADLGSLSQVELLERLALAMERRREDARRAAEAAAVIPQAIVTPFAAPIVEAEPEAKDGYVDAHPPEPAPSWPAAVPSALRPIALDPIDDAVEPLEGFVPPRHIGLTSSEERPGFDERFDPHAAIPFPSSPFPHTAFEAEPEAAEDEEEDSVLQQGYASLFNLSRHAAVRKPFLQFGDPDEAGDEIAHATPVDSAEEIQEESQEFAPFGRPVLLPDPTGEAPADYEERPFDAPRNDPEATERALRAALATLQRMSGAA